jgi:hypothetical protein
VSRLRTLSREAARAALRLRTAHGIGHRAPLSVFDFATDTLKIEVRFLDAAGLEGMYVRTPGPLIVLGADRPVGRQAMTCAHEIGHHVFGHGTTLDRLIEGTELPLRGLLNDATASRSPRLNRPRSGCQNVLARGDSPRSGMARGQLCRAHSAPAAEPGARYARPGKPAPCLISSKFAKGPSDAVRSGSVC